MDLILFDSICDSFAAGELWSIFPKLNEDIENFGPIDAVCDISGRDSIAACIKAFEEGNFKAVLPIVADIPTEYGSYEITVSNIKFLRRLIKIRFGGKVFDPILIGDPEFWGVINGRYVSEIIKKFGFYSPCLGCHLYIHSIRASMAKFIGCNFVISGERESHDGKLKINQLPAALDAYQTVMDELGVRHLLPLRYIKYGSEIERILGIGWKQGDRQLQCVFSNNYYSSGGKCIIKDAQVSSYYKEYAIPLTKTMLHLRMNRKPVSNVYQFAYFD